MTDNADQAMFELKTNATNFDSKMSEEGFEKALGVVMDNFRHVENENDIIVPQIKKSECSVSALSVTWQVLVVFRDLAMDHNDFERAVGYSHVVDDVAKLIAAQGVELPPIPPED